MTIKSLSLIFLILSLSTIAKEKIDDQIRYVSEENQAMKEAIATARSQLDEFFSVAENPPAGSDGFKLKVMVSDESGVEHLWFTPFKKVEGGYVGILVNKPGTILSMQYGEAYAFEHSQITDWGYVLNGKQVGSFTVCVLFKTMDKTIVEQYKRDHGFVCGS
jgi:uncharacterized protein YegJ (DUF2314 family)